MRQTETEELERVKARVTNKAIQKTKTNKNSKLSMSPWGNSFCSKKNTPKHKASYTHIRRYGQPNKRQRETKTDRQDKRHTERRGKRAGEGGERGCLRPQTNQKGKEC